MAALNFTYVAEGWSVLQYAEGEPTVHRPIGRRKTLGQDIYKVLAQHAQTSYRLTNVEGRDLLVGVRCDYIVDAIRARWYIVPAVQAYGVFSCIDV
jgi:hypothetical protein